MFKNNYSETLHYLDRYGKIDIACINCVSINSYIYEDLIYVNENLLCKGCYNLTCIPIDEQCILFKKDKNERIKYLKEMNNNYSKLYGI